jgi:hypothetical protein
MAQRYFSETARDRMAEGRCPECGMTPGTHTDDPRFWIPRRCDLTPNGVVERINQYHADLNEVAR